MVLRLQARFVKRWLQYKTKINLKVIVLSRIHLLWNKQCPTKQCQIKSLLKWKENNILDLLFVKLFNIHNWHFFFTINLEVFSVRGEPFSWDMLEIPAPFLKKVWGGFDNFVTILRKLQLRQGNWEPHSLTNAVHYIVTINHSSVRYYFNWKDANTGVCVCPHCRLITLYLEFAFYCFTFLLQFPTSTALRSVWNKCGHCCCKSLRQTSPKFPDSEDIGNKNCSI